MLRAQLSAHLCGEQCSNERHISSRLNTGWSQLAPFFDGFAHLLDMQLMVERVVVGWRGVELTVGKTLDRLPVNQSHCPTGSEKQPVTLTLTVMGNLFASLWSVAENWSTQNNPTWREESTQTSSQKSPEPFCSELTVITHRSTVPLYSIKCP